MTAFSPDMSARQLLKVANDHHTGVLALTDGERCDLIELLKEKARDELEFGEEVLFEKVRLVRRVTGAVSIFFEKDEPPKAPKAKAKAEVKEEAKEEA